MTLRNRARLILIIIIALAAAGLVSCSPGKKMLQRQQELAAIAAAAQQHDNEVAAAAVAKYVAQNPCSPVPEVNLDSLCSLYYHCPDVSENTPANDYAGADHGPAPVATVKQPPKRILVPWEDKRTINLLEDSIQEKDKRLAAYEALLKNKDAECSNKLDQYKQEARQNRTTLWWIIGLLALFVIGFFVSIARR